MKKKHHHQLVDVLNSDYDDFIALSSDLTDVDAAAAAARAPLRRLRSRLAAAAAEVEGRRVELRQALSERAAAAAARAALELVRDAAAAAEKLDGALVEAGLPAASAAGEGEAGVAETAGDENETAAAADDRREKHLLSPSAPASLSISPPPDSSLDDVLRSLEHCAAAASRLEDLCARAREAPLAAALAPAAARARRTLAAALRGALAAALLEEEEERGAGPSPPSAVHCLQCFSCLGEGRAAEEAVAALAVAPALSEAFRKTLEEKRERIERGERKQPGEEGDSSPSSFSLDASDVPAVLENLRSALEARAGPLLRAVANAAASAASVSSSGAVAPASPFLPLRSLALLPRSVVATVARSILDAFPGALSPGKPEELVASYEAAEAFVSWVDESFAAGGTSTSTSSSIAAAVPRAAGSAEAREFLESWPLQAYFGLRLQEVGSLLEGALVAEEGEGEEGTEGEGRERRRTTATAAAAKKKGPFAAAAAAVPDADNDTSSFSSSVALPSAPLSLRASLGLARSLSRLASKGVFVRPLADRFCGLTLRLCERFRRWLQAEAAARGREARASAASGRGGEEAAALSSSSPSSSSSSAAAAPSVEALCAAASDASAVAAWMRTGEFARALRESVGGRGAGGNDPAASAPAASLAVAVAAAVEHAASKLDAAATSALSAAGTALGLSAAPKLQQQLRGVVTTYRMTPRPPPTRPSPYAAATLAEARGAVTELIRKGASSAGGGGEEEEGRRREHSSLLAAAAVAAVAGAFADTAADVLDAVRRTESSLRRLKNKGGAGGAEGSASEPASMMTDADKIAAQILLDVAAFGKAGKELGCGELGALAEFRRLWEVASAAAGAAEGMEGGSGGGEKALAFDVEWVLASAASRQQQQAVAQPPPLPPPSASTAAPSTGRP